MSPDTAVGNRDVVNENNNNNNRKGCPHNVHILLEETLEYVQ